jgi:hypothetical protein
MVMTQLAYLLGGNNGKIRKTPLVTNNYNLRSSNGYKKENRIPRVLTEHGDPNTSDKTTKRFED